jgi:subtilisin family serine protease
MVRRPAALALVGVAVLAVLAGAAPGPAGGLAAQREVIRGAGAAGAIPDAYIVVFADGGEAAKRVRSAAAGYAVRYGGRVTGTFSDAVRGFTVRMSESAARRLAAEPEVSYVEQDRTVSLAADVQEPAWGLDRVDQRDRELSGTYARVGAAGVTAYILDTGVRISHREFGGRARNGYDFVDNDAVANDCNGHGTHVAGTVGGATYGVASDVKIVGVRVLNCAGSASHSQIIAGVNWVTRHAVKPAVVNMSLGGTASSALDTAVRNSIASGVTYVVAAGNNKVDACTMSPARVSAAVTVGATNRNDARASFSNHGACLDLFAPGVEILSAYRTGDRAAAWMSGTSMAAPHVAGAAALYLARRPDASPAQVREALVTAATRNVVTDARRGSPTALLYTGTFTGPVLAAGKVTSAKTTAARTR